MTQKRESLNREACFVLNAGFLRFCFFQVLRGIPGDDTSVMSYGVTGQYTHPSEFNKEKPTCPIREAAVSIENPGETATQLRFTHFQL